MRTARPAGIQPGGGPANQTGIAAGPNGTSVPGIAGSAGASSTRPVGAAGECAAISQTAQNQLQPADVIWAIDGSGSMDEEMQFVRENMNAFSRQISQSGINVRIVMISDVLRTDAMNMANPNNGMGGGGGRGRNDNGICVDAPLGSGTCPEDTKLPAYLHVPQSVGSNDALDVIVASYPEWMAQLRPNATKSFVVVTDDDAISDESEPDPFGLSGPTTTPIPAERSAGFVAAVKALDPAMFAAFKFHAIYSFTMCEQAAAIGTVYTELVKATGGLSGDLCQQNFQPVFDELARGIVGASQIDCEWVIPAAPPGATFQVGLVNVQYATPAVPAPQTVFHVDAPGNCTPQGGWFYDDNTRPTRISVCPATCDTIKRDASAQVDILFGCATLVPD